MTTGPGAVVASIVCAVIAGVFVGLRLYTRLCISRHPGWDDGLVVVALVFSVVLCPIYNMQLKYGLGDHLKDIPPPKLVKQMTWFWVSTWIYLTGVAFAKVSILIQYIRVFVGRKTIFSSWATIAFIIMCCSICLFGGIFACSPIKRFWDPTVPGTCIHYFAIWYLHCAMSISTDFAIIAIPLPTIFRMNLERRKKWSLAFTFALGGFGCVTSIIRLYYLYFLSVTPDTTHYNPIPALWSTVELNVVIVCACLITLHPLLVRILSPIRRFASNYSQQHSHPLPSHNLNNKFTPPHNPDSRNNNEGRVSSPSWCCKAGGSNGSYSAAFAIGATLLDDSSEEHLGGIEGGSPQHAINVKTTIDLRVDQGSTLTRGRSSSSTLKGSGRCWGGDMELYRIV
ncbi:hypothetical protein B0J12DRAFT_93661 [Macrophomina phaseolina]|uniref:Rhodopsin domain-containing protein n=1 Tax=Macrophomina phaseolina TaxID=35725 RepID=A0ABQ8GB47_9PEZI|nr:hypothetical protein B0J12DRAFT_93661 [Macrophomina phaseolina]